MSNARNLADLLEADGDVKSGALDNVPAADLVDDTTPQLGGDLASNGNDILFADNDKAIFGAGSDLQIYHDGSNSIISDTGTGSLVVQGTSDVYIKGTSTSETLGRFSENGAARLYYNNSEKLATTSEGVTITGDATNTLKIINTDGSATSGPNLVLYRDSGTPADNDEIGKISFNANDSGDNEQIHARITAKMLDITDGTEDSRLVIQTRQNGTLADRAMVDNDGDFHADGDVIAYSTTISDIRLKDNIVGINNALAKVGQLNGYTFEYKADGKVSAGVIAQEVEQVLPEAVSEKQLPLKADDGQEYKVVNYDALHGLLIEAVKELSARVEELEAK